MTCPQIQSLLEDYLDGELAESTAHTVAAHLEECAACRAELALSAKSRDMLREFSVPEPPADYWDEVRELILARTVDSSRVTASGSPAERKTGERASLYQSLLAVAASLVIFFAALLAGSTQAPTASQPVDLGGNPVTKASLVALSCEDSDWERCENEQKRLARGMLLLGRPGLIGGSAELIGTLGIK